MIGRKILDQVDQVLDVPKLSSGRCLQPSPLRLDTVSRTTMKPALNERTNMTVNRNDPISPRTSANSIYTPNSSLTLGRSNPTTNRPKRAGSMCGSSRETTRSNRRYSFAEQALADALKSSTEERSPQELQIWVLHQASVALTTRAQESRERAAKLKLSLAERDTDPDCYVALQQERWMEEKRQLEVDREVGMLTQHLAGLKADRKHGQEEEENRDLPPALNNEARRRANLGRFFYYSPTRTSFHLNLKCRLALDQSLPRRMTMSDVSPLRLRPSSVTPPLRRLTTKHARPVSVAGEPFNPVKRPCKPRPGNSASDVSSLTKAAGSSAKAQSVSDRSSHNPYRLAVNSVTDNSDDIASTRPSTPPLSVASEGSSSSQGIIEESKGTATIISHFSPRTRAEIIADLDQDDVHVPDYAINLLGGFDLIHDEFLLPDRELFIKPREMKPIEVAPPPEPADVAPPSEESDTGPYTSFALPPFTVEPSWSHTSLDSPPSPSTPRMHRPSLQPLTPGSSSPSRPSTPSTPRPSKSSQGPRARHSLLFYMRKRKDGFGDYSPASSSTRVESLQSSPVSSSPVSKKRFSLFSRK
ncbi:hypothetical protein BS17DRAFT_802452 [Gyrodon lividus]|nr:hypothetical protein BS17DRAFT_802452 [Gyrodon lividus]